MLSFLNHFCLFLKKLCGTLFALFKILIGIIISQEDTLPFRVLMYERISLVFFRGTINVDLETIIHLMVFINPIRL